MRIGGKVEAKALRVDEPEQPLTETHVQLGAIDWGIILTTFAVTLGIGFFSARRAGSGATEFFLSGRNMPWWLLGISMVATTFSADTPNLVTDIVRKNGVAGNWVWWAFLLTGMLTVFVYARLWRRSGALTDIEFYELRYSGRSAAFLRGFRALYLGFFFNVTIMATVSLAAIKIGGIMLGLSPVDTIIWASSVTVVVAALGGLRAVLLSDFFLFSLSMTGALVAAYFALDAPEVGGLDALLAAPALAERLSFLPVLETGIDGAYTADSLNVFVSVLVIPIAVQWWSVWYPSAEPGGGGYVAQRMLAARNEQHARAAVLLFNALYYGMRPWPWIIVALCSVLVFPDLDSIGARIPGCARVDHQRRPRVSRDAAADAAGGLARAGRRLAARSLHLDDLDAPELGIFLPGTRLLPPLRAAAGERTRAGAGWSTCRHSP